MICVYTKNMIIPINKIMQETAIVIEKEMALGIGNFLVTSHYIECAAIS